MKGFFHSRKFRQGAMATAITAVVVAIVVVVNFVATDLTDRYNLTLDLTPTGLFSITDETKHYLKQLDKDVTIYILSREEAYVAAGEMNLQAVEVLKKVAQESERITLEFHDYIADPSFQQRYPSLQLASSSILVTCGDKVRDMTPYDLYEIESNEYGYQQATASKAEQVIVSALLAVTSDKAISAAVLTGHSEQAVPYLRNMLTTNNYLVDEVNLLTQEIDPAFSLAIIAGPAADYTEDELRKLDKFLENDGQYGKTILYFASVGEEELPQLSAFLADWGISVGEGIVFETDPARYYSNMPYLAVLDYAESVYSQGVLSAGQYTMTAYARPVSLLFDMKNGVSTSTLLQFSQTAGVVLPESESVEPSGPIPYLVMGQMLTYQGSTPVSSQVLAAGSLDYIGQQFMLNAAFGNAEYLLELLDDLSGREELASIQPKSIGINFLNINLFEAALTGLIVTVIFPLAVLISGLVIWGRRRHR